MQLTGSTILITGGARVGQAVAEALLSAGAQLAMTYLKSPDEVHSKAKGYQADLTDEDSIRRLIAGVTNDFDTIDGLVNMVSIFQPDGENLTLKDIENNFRINAFGNMLTSRLFAKQALKRNARNAPIVSFIDWAVDHPYTNYDVYLAAKAALRHFLMALQISFAGTIRVVNIHPGMILEPPDFPAAEKAMITQHTPTQGIGDPKQAAQLVRLALELDYWADNVRLAGGQQWRHRLR